VSGLTRLPLMLDGEVQAERGRAGRAGQDTARQLQGYQQQLQPCAQLQLHAQPGPLRALARLKRREIMEDRRRWKCTGPKWMLLRGFA